MANLIPGTRSRPAMVLDIFETNLKPEEINPFINTANLLINSQLANKGLGDDLLTEIETWLAAHFVAAWDQRVKSESVAGVSSVTYQGSTGDGLNSTMYGQTAQTLDFTGTLTNLGKMKRAVFNVFRRLDTD